jgi:hypothetical protein
LEVIHTILFKECLLLAYKVFKFIFSFTTGKQCVEAMMEQAPQLPSLTTSHDSGHLLPRPPLAENSGTETRVDLIFLVYNSKRTRSRLGCRVLRPGGEGGEKTT